MPRFGAATGIHRLAFPVEVTTEDGTLATVEAIAAGDDARFFIGALWPLNMRNIPMTWRRSGAATDGAPGLGFKPATSDVREFVTTPAPARP
jgi:hypothetical protein